VDSANIRTGASTSSEVVGKATRGQVFEIDERRGEWHVIPLFSGEYRFVHSSVAEAAPEPPPLTPSLESRRRACRALLAAEKRAMDEAISRHPNSLDAQIDLERLLTDRYKLLVFRDHDVPPARNAALTVWCAKNRTSY
jgi:hypothetical protein